MLNPELQGEQWQAQGGRWGWAGSGAGMAAASLTTCRGGQHLKHSQARFSASAFAIASHIILCLPGAGVSTHTRLSHPTLTCLCCSAFLSSEHARSMCSRPGGLFRARPGSMGWGL